MPIKDPVKRAESEKKYYQANAEKIRKKAKKYRQENREKIKKYQQENPEKIRGQKKRYRQENLEKIRERKKKYRQENREKIREHVKKYRKEREKTDINFRLKKLLRTRVYQYIRAQGASKSQRSEQLLGCTWDEVKIHLEQQWLPKMSWGNHSNGPGNWNIDHIRPLSSFDLSDPEQQRQAFHYTNLQPLWWEDNMAKSDKWQEVSK
jgi:hypothetical protein